MKFKLGNYTFGASKTNAKETDSIKSVSSGNVRNELKDNNSYLYPTYTDSEKVELIKKVEAIFGSITGNPPVTDIVNYPVQNMAKALSELGIMDMKYAYLLFLKVGILVLCYLKKENKFFQPHVVTVGKLEEQMNEIFTSAKETEFLFSEIPNELKEFVNEYILSILMWMKEDKVPMKLEEKTYGYFEYYSNIIVKFIITGLGLPEISKSE